MNELNPVRRAFEVARSGDCKDIQELTRRLKGEGYAATAAHLSAPYLRKQLVTLLKQSRAAPAEPQ
jgi:hypothetical protein